MQFLGFQHIFLFTGKEEWCGATTILTLRFFAFESGIQPGIKLIKYALFNIKQNSV